MDPYIIPTPHRDPWVNILHGYVTEAVGALSAGGVLVHGAWLDPKDPRDATILYSGGGQASSTVSALVWDEETGWRRGDFVDGAQGRRTVLTRIAYLGGGVLPRADELAHRAASPTAATARRYRSRTDLHDGLDDALRRR